MKLKHVLSGILLLLIAAGNIDAINDLRDYAGRVYQLPSKVEGVSRPSILLNGTWQFKYSSTNEWTTIVVPGEVAMQGYAIKHDTPFFYKKTFVVPKDYNGKRIILRFDGVYSKARLSVNGKFIREHNGGFTRWDTDVTQYIKAGKKNEVELEVVDPIDEISYASGYAHHPIGGILRDVMLFVLPENYLYDVSINTHLDTLYRDAKLELSFLPSKRITDIRVNLVAPDGKNVVLLNPRFSADNTQKCTWMIPVSQPLKWDAEHPNLYKLTVAVYNKGKESYRFAREIGFREVKIVGNRMFVNGKQVKLRGACRHDISPDLGRSTTAALDSVDVRLFKEANMNFVRTSHYPPSEHFLNYCDKYGVYVESESAVCFVTTHRQKNYAPGNTQSNPNYTSRYLSQFQEMVKNNRLHPSVLFWSIGNESEYGSNFQACYDWLNQGDTTRSTIFSYPGSDGNKDKIYKILSMHYPGVDGNMTQWNMRTENFQGEGIPALFDEWAHPACYTFETLRRDPNIREFWGKSIDLMWNGVYQSPGALGGAIWGFVDDIFELPKPKLGTAFWKEFAHTQKPWEFQGECVGYGEWGIVDIWRRKKPEFWATKKAYSPVRISIDKITNFFAGSRLTIPVSNRFDNTNLSEIRAFYSHNGIKKEIQLPALNPHENGIIIIPADNWKDGQQILFEFYDAKNGLINSDCVTLGNENIKYPEALKESKLSVNESNGFITVKGDNFEIPFSKETGLIENAKADGKILIEKGPFLNLFVSYNNRTNPELRKNADTYLSSDSDWVKTSFSYQQKSDGIYVKLTGTYKNILVDYLIKVMSNGMINVDFNAENAPNGYCRESGICFKISKEFEGLKWNRKAYWNIYPENSFADREGSALLYNSKQTAYGVKPVQDWQDDTHDYYYWSDAGANCMKPLTQKAKGMKENIYFYTLSDKENHQLSVISTEASIACRLNKLANEQLILFANSSWDYPEIGWGNYAKMIDSVPCYGNIMLMIK